MAASLPEVLPRRYHMGSKPDFVDKRRVILHAPSSVSGRRRAAWRRGGDVSLAIDLVEATHLRRYGEGV